MHHETVLVAVVVVITGSPNNKTAWLKTAWLELLHFGPVILAKPKRGGSKRNLSNIINSHTAAWDKDAVPTDIHRLQTVGPVGSQTTTAS